MIMCKRMRRPSCGMHCTLTLSPLSLNADLKKAPPESSLHFSRLLQEVQIIFRTGEPPGRRFCCRIRFSRLRSSSRPDHPSALHHTRADCHSIRQSLHICPLPHCPLHPPCHSDMRRPVSFSGRLRGVSASGVHRAHRPCVSSAPLQTGWMPALLYRRQDYFSTSSIASLLYWLKLTLLPSASSTGSIVSGRSSPYNFVSMNSSPLK